MTIYGHVLSVYNVNTAYNTKNKLSFNDYKKRNNDDNV